MPNGRFKWSANTAREAAVPSGVNPCNTTTCPAAESATNTSPLGATANHRGFVKSLAKIETANPGGTWGTKLAGGFATTGQFSTRVNLDKRRARHPPTLNARIVTRTALR